MKLRTQIISVIAAVTLVIILVIIFNSLFIVTELEQAVVKQFGNVVSEVTDPGLHWKIPFIQKVYFLDKRIMEWDGEATQVTTLGKKFITVDTWARWRIVDPKTFIIAIKDEMGGQAALDDHIESAVRDAISSLPLQETVRLSTNRTLEYVTKDLENTRAEPKPVKVGRDKLVQQIKEAAAKGLEKGYGIELVDVQIKHLNYVEQVREDVYSRMSSERERIAAKFISEAHSEENKILGKMKQDLDTIESEGYKEARIIKGEADAKAAQIYADAYGKEPEFYSFLKTLETYEDTMDEKTVLVLTTGSDYFKPLLGNMKVPVKKIKAKTK